jgi:PAB-dependent poly(A)-specific ribonuclease subunit 3
MQLDYHLYVTPLPHVQALHASSSSHSSSSNIHTFFLSPSTHQSLLARTHAALETTPVPIPNLPRSLHVYHSLHPLEPGGSQAEARAEPSVLGGLRTEAFRASSMTDGNLYCLRRIEGFKIVHDQAFSSIESWRRIVHPGVVGVKEAFTTRAFGDSCMSALCLPRQ